MGKDQPLGEEEAFMQMLGGKCFVGQLKPSLHQKNVKIVVPLQMVTAAMKLRHLFLGRKVMTNLDSILKSRDITLLTKVSSQSYGFSSSGVQM